MELGGLQVRVSSIKTFCFHILSSNVIISLQVTDSVRSTFSKAGATIQTVRISSLLYSQSSESPRMKLKKNATKTGDNRLIQGLMFRRSRCRRRRQPRWSWTRSFPRLVRRDARKIWPLSRSAAPSSAIRILLCKTDKMTCLDLSSKSVVLCYVPTSFSEVTTEDLVLSRIEPSILKEIFKENNSSISFHFQMMSVTTRAARVYT
jgi:hypothetical protein